eukprot:m.154446 g.154446  ORF g.154446 m.154446 type:complete len:2031 (+) comp16385_c0_seq1:56-6148(+)
MSFGSFFRAAASLLKPSFEQQPASDSTNTRTQAQSLTDPTHSGDSQSSEANVSLNATPVTNKAFEPASQPSHGKDHAHRKRTPSAHRSLNLEREDRALSSTPRNNQKRKVRPPRTPKGTTAMAATDGNAALSYVERKIQQLSPPNQMATRLSHSSRSRSALPSASSDALSQDTATAHVSKRSTRQRSEDMPTLTRATSLPTDTTQRKSNHPRAKRTLTSTDSLTEAGHSLLRVTQHGSSIEGVCELLSLQPSDTGSRKSSPVKSATSSLPYDEDDELIFDMDAPSPSPVLLRKTRSLSSSRSLVHGRLPLNAALDRAVSQRNSRQVSSARREPRQRTKAVRKHDESADETTSPAHTRQGIAKRRSANKTTTKGPDHKPKSSDADTSEDVLSVTTVSSRTRQQKQHPPAARSESEPKPIRPVSQRHHAPSPKDAHDESGVQASKPEIQASKQAIAKKSRASKDASQSKSSQPVDSKLSIPDAASVPRLTRSRPGSHVVDPAPEPTSAKRARSSTAPNPSALNGSHKVKKGHVAVPQDKTKASSTILTNTNTRPSTRGQTRPRSHGTSNHTSKSSTQAPPTTTNTTSGNVKSSTTSHRGRAAATRRHGGSGDGNDSQDPPSSMNTPATPDTAMSQESKRQRSVEMLVCERVRSLRQPTTTNPDRVDAYLNLSSYLQGESGFLVATELLRRSQQLFPAVLADMTSRELDLCSSAIRMIVATVTFNNITLADQYLQQLIATLHSIVIQSHERLPVSTITPTSREGRMLGMTPDGKPTILTSSVQQALWALRLVCHDQRLVRQQLKYLFEDLHLATDPRFASRNLLREVLALSEHMQGVLDLVDKDQDLFTTGVLSIALCLLVGSNTMLHAPAWALTQWCLSRLPTLKLEQRSHILTRLASTWPQLLKNACGESTEARNRVVTVVAVLFRHMYPELTRSKHLPLFNQLTSLLSLGLFSTSETELVALRGWCWLVAGFLHAPKHLTSLSRRSLVFKPFTSTTNDMSPASRTWRHALWLALLQHAYLDPSTSTESLRSQQQDQVLHLLHRLTDAIVHYPDSSAPDSFATSTLSFDPVEARLLTALLGDTFLPVTFPKRAHHPLLPDAAPWLQTAPTTVPALLSLVSTASLFDSLAVLLQRLMYTDTAASAALGQHVVRQLFALLPEVDYNHRKQVVPSLVAVFIRAKDFVADEFIPQFTSLATLLTPRELTATSLSVHMPNTGDGCGLATKLPLACLSEALLHHSGFITSVTELVTDEMMTGERLLHLAQGRICNTTPEKRPATAPDDASASVLAPYRTLTAAVFAAAMPLAHLGDVAQPLLRITTHHASTRSREALLLWICLVDGLITYLLDQDTAFRLDPDDPDFSAVTAVLTMPFAAGWAEHLNVGYSKTFGTSWRRLFAQVARCAELRGVPRNIYLPEMVTPIDRILRAADLTLRPALFEIGCEVVARMVQSVKFVRVGGRAKGVRKAQEQQERLTALWKLAAHLLDTCHHIATDQSAVVPLSPSCDQLLLALTSLIPRINTTTVLSHFLDNFTPAFVAFFTAVGAARVPRQRTRNAATTSSPVTLPSPGPPGTPKPLPHPLRSKLAGLWRCLTDVVIRLTAEEDVRVLYTAITPLLAATLTHRNQDLSSAAHVLWRKAFATVPDLPHTPSLQTRLQLVVDADPTFHAIGFSANTPSIPSTTQPAPVVSAVALLEAQSYSQDSQVATETASFFAQEVQPLRIKRGFGASKGHSSTTASKGAKTMSRLAKGSHTSRPSSTRLLDTTPPPPTTSTSLVVSEISSSTGTTTATAATKSNSSSMVTATSTGTEPSPVVVPANNQHNTPSPTSPEPTKSLTSILKASPGSHRTRRSRQSRRVSFNLEHNTNHTWTTPTTTGTSRRKNSISGGRRPLFSGAKANSKHSASPPLRFKNATTGDVHRHRGSRISSSGPSNPPQEPRDLTETPKRNLSQQFDSASPSKTPASAPPLGALHSTGCSSRARKLVKKVRHILSTTASTDSSKLPTFPASGQPQTKKPKSSSSDPAPAPSSGGWLG